MGKSSPTPPTPPDPVKTASAQTGSNIGTAIANATIGNANTYGPTGSTVYNQIGNQKITGPDGQIYGVPQYSQTTTLSPEQQGLYNQQTKLSGDLNNLALGQTARLSGCWGSPSIPMACLPCRALLTPRPRTSLLAFEGRGMTATNYANGLPNDFSADRSAVEKSLFDRINPQLDRDKSALENKLVNQGFQRGTTAFNNEMDAFNRQVNDQRLAITGQGLQEQQGLYGMARDKAGFGSSEDARAFNQALQSGQFGSQEQARGFNQALQGGQFGSPRKPAGSIRRSRGTVRLAGTEPRV
jgi:hypothetical protein